MANYGGYGYQYETSPKKLQPEYVPTKKAKKKTNVKPQNTKKPSKQQKNKYNYKPVVYIGLAFVMLFTISYRYSQINEEFNQMQSLKKELSSLQKENEQLKVGIENGLNYTTIEKIAKEKLGMQKITNKQIEYVSLPKKDYVESSSEKVIINNQKNWFEQFVDKVFNR